MHFIKEPVDNMPHIWPEEPVLLGEALFIDLLQRFKVILNTPVILGILWLARAIDRRYTGHELSLPRKNGTIPANIYCKLY